MSEEIDHDSTDEVVCPYCGHEHNDSHEWFRDNLPVRITCEKCNRQFKADQDFIVTYTTEKL